MTNVLPKQSRQIGPVGTVARLGGAVALLGLAFAGVFGNGVSWAEGVAGFVAFPAAILVLHVATVRVLGRPLQDTSGVGFCLNLALGAVLFNLDATRELTAVFAGSSLVLAAARGYAGCEVLAISNFVLRRQDQVGCVVFSPLDQIETRLSGARIPQESL